MTLNPLAPDKKGPSQVCGEIASVIINMNGKVRNAKISCWPVNK